MNARKLQGIQTLQKGRETPKGGPVSLRLLFSQAIVPAITFADTFSLWNPVQASSGLPSIVTITTAGPTPALDWVRNLQHLL
jgi:hypothetical protein